MKSSFSLDNTILPDIQVGTGVVHFFKKSESEITDHYTQKTIARNASTLI